MNLRYILLAIVAGTIVSVAFGVSPTKVSKADAAKARYYYTQALKALATNSGPEAYEYLDHAYRLDPTNEDVAFDLGSYRINMDIDSLGSDTEKLRSFSLMTPYVKKFPGDVSKAQYYAYQALQMDSVSEALATYKGIDEASSANYENLPMLADAYMRHGDRDMAIATLNRFQAIEGYSPQLTLRKASYRLSGNDTVGAFAEADELIRSNPREPEYRLLKGNIYTFLAMPDSALTCYLEAENLDSENGATQYSIAEYYKAKGDSVEYDARIYKALLAENFGLEEKTTLLRDYLGKLVEDKSETSRADTLFRVLNDQYPHEPTLLELAARWSASKGDFSDAVEQIGYAIDMDPSNSDYWPMLISYNIAADRPQEAMEAYHRALEHIEEDSDLTLAYAGAAQMADSIQVAVDAYGKLIHDIVPSFPVLGRISDKNAARDVNFYGLYYLSSFYEMLGDALYSYFKKHPEEKDYLEHTYDAYENSLLLIDDNAGTLNNYAYFLCENGGDLEKAKSMSERAVAANETSTTLDTYAWILFRMGDYKDARTYQASAIEKAAEEGTLSEELYSHYGDILFMNGLPDEAVENWKKALELSPDDELLKKKVEHRTFFYN